MSLAKKQNLQEELRVSSFLPFTHFVTPSIIMTKNGYLVATLTLEGLHVEHLINQNVDNEHQILKSTIANLSSRFALWCTSIRKREDVQIPPNILNSFSQSFADEYYRKLNSRELFSNRHYLTLILKPQITKNLFNFNCFKKLSTNYVHQIEKQKTLKDIAYLENALAQIKTNLKNYHPRLLGVRKEQNCSYAEPLEFYYFLINLTHKKIFYPRCNISEVLPDKRIFIGNNAVQLLNEIDETNYFVSIQSIKKYAALTYAGLLNPLLRLPQDMIITQIFMPVEKEAAKDQIKRQRRQFFQSGDEAYSQVDQIEQALDDLQSDRMSFGLHNGFITCLAQNPHELIDRQVNVNHALTDLGFKLVRETINLESAFWSQIPGNVHEIRRLALISSENYADTISLHNSYKGHRGHNHLGQEIMTLETPNRECFYFNFHRKGDKGNVTLGHTTLIGPSGAGKTTLLAVFDTMLRKLHAKTYVLDYRFGMKNYILNLNGEYQILTSNKPTGINPVPKIDTPMARLFLQRFLKSLIIRDNEEMCNKSEQQISAAIDGVYTLNPPLRNFRNLCQFFSKHWDKYERIKMWLAAEQGDKAFLFDNTDDDLELNKDIVGFDLTQIMQDKIALLPVVLYLFFRIEMNLDGKLTAILLDEGWQFLNHPYWQDIIKSWLVTLRKENAFVVFATQNPREVAQSGLAYGLIQGAATNIYLANPDAQAADYMDVFNLNAKEFEIIKKLKPQEHYFLIKQDHISNVARCNLQGMDDYLRIFSGIRVNNNLNNKAL